MLDFDGSRRPVWIGAGGAAVGAVFGSSVAVLALGQGEIQHLALFTCILAAFHGLEFFTAAVWREAEVNFNSYCINHSSAYGLAMALALVEFWGMRLLFSVPASSPAYWTSWWAAGWIIGAGAVLSVAGLCLRYWAMMETGTSFNHIVQDKRPESHRLVTTGPYRISRHPSYVGWALWAVGTQILLCNPISALLFAAASTAFFRKRVIGEEAALLEWYGDEYVRYATNTPILLPGVSTSPRLQARISSMQAAA